MKNDQESGRTRRRRVPISKPDSSNRIDMQARERTINRLSEYSTAAYRADFESIPEKFRREYRRAI